jgi:hypothetical protein
LIAGIAGQIEQRVGLGHGHAPRALGELDDLIPASNFALLQHAKVKPRSVVRYEQSGHARFVHPNANPVAGNARLRHLEERAPDPIPIANANFIVRKAFDSEVLAELPIDEVVSPELLFPVTIGVKLIYENGAVFTPMTAQVALAIAVNVKPSYHATALDGTFPHGCMYGLSLPRDVTRETHVN